MFDGLTMEPGSPLFIAAAGVGLGLIILIGVMLVMRRRNSALFVRGGKSRQPRLMVLDAAAVDAKRRLVLIRRDDVEHLIMIGGPTDIVIESRIGESRIGESRIGAEPEQRGARDQKLLHDALFDEAVAHVAKLPVRPVAGIPSIEPVAEKHAPAPPVSVAAPVKAPEPAIGIRPVTTANGRPAPPPVNSAAMTPSPGAARPQPVPPIAASQPLKPLAGNAGDSVDAARHRVPQPALQPVMAPRESAPPASPHSAPAIVMDSPGVRPEILGQPVPPVVHPVSTRMVEPMLTPVIPTPALNLAEMAAAAPSREKRIVSDQDALAGEFEDILEAEMLANGVSLDDAMERPAQAERAFEQNPASGLQAPFAAPAIAGSSVETSLEKETARPKT